MSNSTPPAAGSRIKGTGNPLKLLVWKLYVPEPTPLANEFLRMHWSRRSEIRKRWGWLLLEAGVRGIPTAERKRSVLVVRRSPGDPDYANLWTPIDKLILDNLVEFGALVDDSPQWLDLAARSEHGTGSMEIEITEL